LCLKLEKSNKLRLQKIQSNSKIKLNRDQYLRYKEILFNHSLEKRGKIKEDSEDDKENENKNYINLPKKVYSSYDPVLPAKEISKSLCFFLKNKIFYWYRGI